MTITLILLLVFISQIWLLSYFYPTQITKRINYVLANYPKKDYPKLYPVSVEKIQTVRNIYLGINYLCIILGVAIIINYGILPDDYRENLNVLDDIPLLFGLVQYVPLMLLELIGFKQMKLMRELNKTTSRKADLQPRHLFDYIPKVYVILAFIIYAAFIVFELVISEGILTSDFAIKLGTVTLVNILFVFLAMSNVYGKKRDPFQKDNDRFKQAKFAIQTLVFISIFMTIYLMAHSLVNAFDYNYVEIVINSLYFQVIALYTLIALLGRFKVDTMNFDVYKADTTPS